MLRQPSYAGPPGAAKVSALNFPDFTIGSDGPDTPTTIDPKRYQDLLTFARKCLPTTLGQITNDDEIAIKILSGGTSNQLYVVSAKRDFPTVVSNNGDENENDKDGNTNKASNSPVAVSSPLITPSTAGATTTTTPAVVADECVVRVFGEGLSEVVDRESEFHWQRQFLATFGRCKNGLAYEFLRGYVPIGVDGVRRHSAPICRALAALHLRSIHAATTEEATRIPLSRKMLTNWIDRACSDRIVDRALRKCVVAGDEEATRSSVEFMTELTRGGKLRKLAAELLSLIDSPDMTPFQVIVPGCHNDANVLNIMVPKEVAAEDKEQQKQQQQQQQDENQAANSPAVASSSNGSGSEDLISPTTNIKLIDFEYAGVNYVAWELGNHIHSEWSGLEANYDKLRPSVQEQQEFVKLYLTTLAEEHAATQHQHPHCKGCALQKQLNSSNPRCFCSTLSEFAKNPDEVVAKWMRACHLHALVSHVGWSAWCVSQQSGSQIETFDYVDYARKRMAEFERQRAALQ